MVCATDTRMVETVMDLPTPAENLAIPDGAYRTVERAVPGAAVSLGEPFGFEVEAAALLQ